MRDSINDTTIFSLMVHQKIMTVETLSTLLNRSVKTARRQLKQWKAYTSYNENARYYTLPGIPEFDAHGLWSYRQVRFSRYGNATQTMIHAVTQSSCGLDAAECMDLLGISVRTLLTSLRHHPEMTREKIQGRFVYFSAIPIHYTSQKVARIGMPRHRQLPTEREAITILVETIKHPHLSVEDLSRVISVSHAVIPPQRIHALFTYHGLTRKKTLTRSF